MLKLISKRLELKIIFTLMLAIACSVGIFTYVDSLHVRSDMIHTSERTLGAFAAAIKGSVSASMKNGQHEIAKLLLHEIQAPALVERLMIYNEQGRPLYSKEMLSDDATTDRELPQDIREGVLTGDQSRVLDRGGRSFISYYAPLENRPECHRCHGSEVKLNGILRVDFSLNELSDLVDARRRRDLIWSASLIILLVVVLATLLRRVVYRPVRELRDAMASAAEGHTPLIAPVFGGDELADLKRSFVEMVAKVNTLHHANLAQEVQLAHSQELTRFRSELQAMFDAMPDGVLMVDRALRIAQSNRRIYEMLPSLRTAGTGLGAERDEAVQGLRGSLSSAFVDGQVHDHNGKIALPDGAYRYFQSICAPVIDDGNVVFVVGVVRDMTDRITVQQQLEEKTDELRRTNRLLARLAITDGLTQLYNRRHFDEILYKEIKRFNRRKYTSLALMLIDIDHFKQMNDRYGHLAGDNVLRELATILKQEVRETDTVARYGGEEFAVIMPDTHIDGAAYKADLLRQRVQTVEIRGVEPPIRITISIGVAEYVSGFPHDLVQAADKALYQAKQDGRNTVVVRRRDEVEA